MDQTEDTTLHVISLTGLLRNVPCFIVRMRGRDDYSIWPEVLVARSEAEAHALCEYLNLLSFQFYFHRQAEDDPDTSEVLRYKQWASTNTVKYVVEFAPDLSQYSEIHRIAYSLMLARELFDNMAFHDSL